MEYNALDSIRNFIVPFGLTGVEDGAVGKHWGLKTVQMKALTRTATFAAPQHDFMIVHLQNVPTAAALKTELLRLAPGVKNYGYIIAFVNMDCLPRPDSIAPGVLYYLVGYDGVGEVGPMVMYRVLRSEGPHIPVPANMFYYAHYYPASGRVNPFRFNGHDLTVKWEHVHHDSALAHSVLDGLAGIEIGAASDAPFGLES